MKYLVMGVCGMAGHVIAQHLIEKGHEVIGFARTKSPCCETIIGDIFEMELVKKIIIDGKYDVVVNCIGILNKKVDFELAKGIFTNSFFPHYIAQCCDEVGTKMVHISTDCVFSGKKGSYDENSIPDDISYYARTKYLGEVINGKHLTLRTSIIGPELKENGVGLFHWFMKQENRVEGYNNVLWSGVTTIELAKIIENSHILNLSGLYQLTNNRKISKYELLLLFNKNFKKNKIQIVIKDEPISDKTLICTRTDFLYLIPDYENMIVEMKNWIENHRSIYNQYFGGIS